MNNGMSWFRWHHGSANDPKFRLVARRAGASVPEALAVWALLLESASGSEQRGTVGPLHFESIDCSMDMPDGRSAAIFAAMQHVGLIDAGGRISSWDKRQPKREDEGATARKRRQREREAGPQDAPDEVTSVEASAATVTQRHAESAAVTPRVRERVEKSNTPLPPSSDAEGGTPPAEQPEEPEPVKRRGRKPSETLTLVAWLTLCRAKGERAIPLTDPVFRYAESIELPPDMLWLAWEEFKRRYATKSKRYRDWRAVFRQAVEGNWFRLWYADQRGAFALTTQGLQAQRVHEAEARERAE